MKDPNHSPCPECGSQRLTWRIYRPAGRTLASLVRQIRWTCGGCGIEWTESLAHESRGSELADLLPEM